MTDKPPEPINLTTIIINRNKEKHCDCYNWINKMKGIKPSYEIDTENRIVICKHCGVYVDAFEALLTIAKYGEEMEREVKQLCEIAKAAAEYKPWRKAMKNIEQHVGRKCEMLPTCPHCHEAFRLEQVATGVFVNKIVCKNEGWANKC